MKSKLMAILLGALLMGGIWTSGYHSGYSSRNQEAITEQRKAEDKYNELYDSKLQALSDISYSYQVELNSINAQARSDIDALNSTGQRLRFKVKQLTEEREGLQSRCFPDGYAELDSGAAERVVAITKKGDKWIETLQETVRVLSNENKKLREKSIGK